MLCGNVLVEGLLHRLVCSRFCLPTWEKDILPSSRQVWAVRLEIFIICINSWLSKKVSLWFVLSSLMFISSSLVTSSVYWSLVKMIASIIVCLYLLWRQRKEGEKSPMGLKWSDRTKFFWKDCPAWTSKSTFGNPYNNFQFAIFYFIY